MQLWQVIPDSHDSANPVPKIDAIRHDPQLLVYKQQAGVPILRKSSALLIGSLSVNTRACAAYAKHGYTPYEVVLEKDIGERSEK